MNNEPGLFYLTVIVVLVVVMSSVTSPSAITTKKKALSEDLQDTLRAILKGKDYFMCKALSSERDFFFRFFFLFFFFFFFVSSQICTFFSLLLDYAKLPQSGQTDPYAPTLKSSTWAWLVVLCYTRDCKIVGVFNLKNCNV